MDSVHFTNHLERLKAQTENLRETLSAFRSNYTALQFGMQRLQNEINRSREQFDQLTGGLPQGAPVIRMNFKADDNEAQMTA